MLVSCFVRSSAAFHPRQWLPPGLPLLAAVDMSGPPLMHPAAAGPLLRRDIKDLSLVTDLEQAYPRKAVADLFESVLGLVLNESGLEAAFDVLLKLGMHEFHSERLDAWLKSESQPVLPVTLRQAVQRTGFVPQPLRDALVAMTRGYRRMTFFRRLSPACPVRFAQVPALRDTRWQALQLYPGWRQGTYRHPIVLSPLQVRQLEALLAYQFTDAALLNYAVFRSSTYDATGLASFERLEFLGDAVIDYLVTCFLMHKFPSDSPWLLTRRRQRMVNNKRFAEVLDQMQVFHVVMSADPDLSAADCAVWAEHRAATATHGCVFEALVGAVYVDSGLNLDAVWTSFGAYLCDVIKTPNCLEPL